MDTTNTKTFEIPSTRLPELKKKLDKLVRKANKLGTAQISYTVGTSFAKPFLKAGHSMLPLTEEGAAKHKAVGDIVQYVNHVPVTVTGETPRLAGWSFVATLQHVQTDEGYTNILRTVPFFEGNLPEQYRHADPKNCDHCHKAITTRKETFIVRHENGTWKQVGRNCTQDFLGGLDPHDVAMNLSLLFQAMDLCKGYGEGMGGFHADAFEMGSYLATVAMLVRHEGFVSRGAARIDPSKVATADRAVEYIVCPSQSPTAQDEWANWHKEWPILEADAEMGEAALAFVQEDVFGRDNLNDYLYSLTVVAKMAFLDRKTLGLAASMISCYQRELGMRVQRENERLNSAGSRHFGEIGKRLKDLVVSVTDIRTINGMYGTTWIVKMLTQEGNVATWFASSNPGMEVGKEYMIAGTPKKHDVYNGVTQTILSRCTVYTEEGRRQAEAKAAQKTKKA